MQKPTIKFCVFDNEGFGPIAYCYREEMALEIVKALTQYHNRTVEDDAEFARFAYEDMSDYTQGELDRIKDQVLSLESNLRFF